MAWTLVGQKTGSAINGGNISLDLTALTGGIAAAPSQDDILLFFGGSTNGGTFTGTGWTLLYDDGSTFCYYKIMGATPDTAVTMSGHGTSTDSACAAVQAWRGVDLSTPIDVAVPAAASGAFSVPDSPSITTVTTGALVFSLAVNVINDATITAPTGYSNLSNTTANDTTPSSIGMASKVKTPAGAENPGAYSNWTTSSVGWVAITVALRPAASVIFAPTKGDLTLTGKTALGTTTLIPTKGDIALTGQSANLFLTTILAPTKGDLTLTGKDAVLQLTMAPVKGDLTLTGQSAGLVVGTFMPTSATMLLLTGSDVTANITMATAKGDLALAGQQAGLIYNTILSTSAGALALAGQTAVGRITLGTTKGDLSLAGQDASFRVGFTFSPTKGDLVLTGQVASFQLSIVLQAESATLRLLPGCATFRYYPNVVAGVLTVTDVTPAGILFTDKTAGVLAMTDKVGGGMVFTDRTFVRTTTVVDKEQC